MGGHSHGMDEHALADGFALHEVLAGATAGLAEHLAMFPFDTIKTRMQDEGHTFRMTMNKVIKTEPWRHLYRGCVPVLCSAVPAHGAYFGVYEAAKRRFGADQSNYGIALAAACATMAHDAVSIPFDVVKQRMQVDASNQYRNSLDCCRSILRSEGVSALFVSLPTTVAMNIPHMATQWLVYETIKDSLVRRGEVEDESALHFVLAGLAAGGCAAAVSTPLDNIKTQLQLGHYKSAAEAVTAIARQRGVLGGFFKGALPRVCHMAPSAAITLTTYEAMKSLLA